MELAWYMNLYVCVFKMCFLITTSLKSKTNVYDLTVYSVLSTENYDKKESKQWSVLPQTK